jgi:hypothetical protein
MKLELKHLAPYLPYRLKFVRGNSGYLEFVMDCAGSCYIYSENKLRYDYRDVRPILRPLSDLATNNEVLDLLYKECQGIDENIDYWCEFKGDMTNTSISFRASQILFKHHFDVFGLIEKGLAIDINTIT